MFFSKSLSLGTLHQVPEKTDLEVGTLPQAPVGKIIPVSTYFYRDLSAIYERIIVVL